MKKIVVLAKQVPDTANVGANAMKEDGTVNRAALKSIFNPEDLNALEMALSIKEQLGYEVHVLSMGPSTALTVLKHSLYMGADQAYLISDRKFAGADTLATAYVLSEAIRKLDDVVLVLAGKQAIDGDTGQVGPQVANLLGMNAISYVSQLEKVSHEHIIVARDGEVQTEIIRTAFPVLLAVTHSANEPRYPSAHRMLRYFRADIHSNIPEIERETAQKNGWVIHEWNLANLGLAEEKCGLKGSPTKVHNIKNITLTGKDLEMYPNETSGVKALVKELIKDYIEG